MKVRRGVFVSSFITAVVLAGVLLLAGPLNVRVHAQQSASAAMEVKIDNFSFSPATLTVAVGTTVTWTNQDDIPHTVVSTDDPRAFRSKVLDTDEKFTYTFSKAGTFAYFCSVHPKMTGTVVVK
jgi:plastocyanin